MADDLATPKTGQFTEYHRSELAKRAISLEAAVSAGILPLVSDCDRLPGMPDYWSTEHRHLPALAYPWRSVQGGEIGVQWQIKPDTPQLDKDGRPRKYLFAKGFRPMLNPIRVGGHDKTLIVEGTHQSIAAGIYAPPGWNVLGIAGCHGWSVEGLPINDLLSLAGHAVVIALDADISKNLQVWEAGQSLADELEMSGAASVRFATVTGGAKAGLDDVLGGRPEHARADYLLRLLDPARTKVAKDVRRPTRDAAKEAERVSRAAERAAIEQVELAAEEATGRKRVDVGDDRLAVVNQLVAEIRRWGDGRGIFNRGGMLVRRHRDELTPLTRASLTDVITSAARTGRPGLTGSWEDCWPDGGSMDNILSRWRDFSALDQVVSAPFLRVDGTVCQTNGYDSASRTYVRMDKKLRDGLDIPDEPTPEDVRWALAVLDDWLIDFPFPSAADKAHALAWMITPFIRGLVDVVPIAVIDGNGPSAGKGLLAELFTRLVLGTPFEPTTMPNDNDEARKAITAAFLDGSSVLIWDEAHVLEGVSLAQMLTAPVWRDRKLGVNVMARVPNRITFAALGNNVRVNGDVGRRAYRIRLHPQMERPEDRPASGFRHPDIKRWTEEHRAALLSAVLTLIRAWHVAGRPSGPDNFGSFERWSRIVGGILANAGVPGFLAGMHEWRNASNEAVDAWASHLDWLAQEFVGRQFRSADVAKRMVRAGSDAILPSADRSLASPEDSTSYVRLLGKCYQHRRDQTYNGLTLIQVGKRDGSALWEVKVSGVMVPVKVSDLTRDKTPTVGGSDKTTSYAPPESQDKTASYNSLEGSEGSEGVPTLGPMRTTTECVESCTHPCTHSVVSRREGGVVLPFTPLTPLDTGPVPQLLVLSEPVCEPGSQSAQVVVLNQYDRSDPDQYLRTVAEPYESFCPRGCSEVLVDGLWFACPTHQPASAHTTTQEPSC